MYTKDAVRSPHLCLIVRGGRASVGSVMVMGLGSLCAGSKGPDVKCGGKWESLTDRLLASFAMVMSRKVDSIVYRSLCTGRDTHPALRSVVAARTANLEGPRHDHLRI